MSTYGDNDPGVQIVTVLKRRKAIIAVTTLIFVGFAALFALLPTRVYRSSAAIVISSASGNDEVVVNVQEADRHVRNERDFIRSDAVENAVRDRLNFKATVQTIQISGADVLEVVAQDPEARRAASIANTYADVYLDLRRADLVNSLNAQGQAVSARIAEIDAQLSSSAPDAAGSAEQTNLRERRSGLQATEDQLRSQADVAGETGVGRIIRNATPPSVPVDTGLLRYMFVGLFAGFVVGAALALARDARDDTIRLSDERVGDLRVIAVVPPSAPGRASGARTGARRSARASGVEESYALLRLTLDGANPDRATRVIQVAAPGRTVLTAEAVCGMGQAYHSTHRRVLLVSADMGRAHLHERCGIPSAPGLGSFVKSTSRANVEPFRVRGQEELMALAADPGGLHENQVAPEDLVDAFTRFRELAEIVIVESGPLLRAESLELSRIADAIVIVAEEGSTQLSDIARAADRVRVVGAECAGIVLFSAGWSRFSRRAVASLRTGDEPTPSDETLLTVGR